jgi:hypothetical protein
VSVYKIIPDRKVTVAAAFIIDNRKLTLHIYYGDSSK